MSNYNEYWGAQVAAQGDCHRPCPLPCLPPCPPKEPCPQLPGTLLRIFIPAGAVINFANLIEVASPSGICLIIRLPFLGKNGKKHSSDSNFNFNINDIIAAVQNAGGSVEFG